MKRKDNEKVDVRTGIDWEVGIWDVWEKASNNEKRKPKDLHVRAPLLPSDPISRVDAEFTTIILL